MNNVLLFLLTCQLLQLVFAQMIFEEGSSPSATRMYYNCSEYILLLRIEKCDIDNNVKRNK